MKRSLLLSKLILLLSVISLSSTTMQAHKTSTLDDSSVAPLITLHTQQEVGAEVNLVIAGENIHLSGIELIREEEQFGEIVYTYKVLDKDISISGDVTKLSIDYFDVDQIKLQKASTIRELSCNSNPLESLDVTSCTSLQVLDCGSCSLSRLDLSQAPALTYLDCSNNSLTELDLSNNAKLETLSVQQNGLTAMNLSALQDLTYLIISKNALGTLDLSKNLKLKNLQADEIGLTRIDLSANKQLELLHLAQNKLQTFSLESLTLKELYINDNNLTSLELKSPSLELLCAYANQLTDIDLTNLPNLNTISLHSNTLSTIDLSKTPKLEYLWVQNNKLSALDLSSSPLLLTLECYRNALDEGATLSLVNTLPDQDPSLGATLIIVNNPIVDKNYCSKDAVAKAKAKGWGVYDLNEEKSGYPGLPYEGKETANEWVDNPKAFIIQTHDAIYPNTPFDQAVVYLYDSVGNLLLKGVPNRPISTALLPSGVYHIVILSEDQVLLVQSIVKSASRAIVP